MKNTHDDKQFSDDVLEKLLEEALEKPGVKEVMLVYGQWEELIENFFNFTRMIEDQEIITLSNSTTGL